MMIMNGMMMRTLVAIIKGHSVTVRSESGHGVNCPIIDVENNRVWVRFPTGSVIDMGWDDRRRLYVGRSARLEFTVDPRENS